MSCRSLPGGNWCAITTDLHGKTSYIVIILCLKRMREKHSNAGNIYFWVCADGNYAISVSRFRYFYLKKWSYFYYKRSKKWLYFYCLTISVLYQSISCSSTSPKCNFHVRASRTIYVDTSVKCRGTLLWNQLKTLSWLQYIHKAIGLVLNDSRMLYDKLYLDADVHHNVMHLCVISFCKLT